jgi:hypothetical protein
MFPSAHALPSQAAAPPREPSLAALLVIFWGAFAAAVCAARVMVPDIFARQDPDALMRLVQVRDLLAGQGWFDLVQHRLSPPAGVLMHWSRLIDAPIAGLILVGNLFGDGEAFALTLWPLLLLLCFMGASMAIATGLGGRAAALPTLLLSLLFFQPLLAFLPNDIDHHNAQIALLAGLIACALRLAERPIFGLLAGWIAALMLAIGLEMLPYVGLVGAGVALQWAWRGQGARGTAAFGAAFGGAPIILYVAAGSAEAAMACDSLSLAYAGPLALAGLGLAALTLLPAARPLRLAGLALLGLAVGGLLAAIAPECLAGPYGALSPELTSLWLSNITEAQPIPTFAPHEPVGLIAILGPPVVALAVALARLWRGKPAARLLWSVPTLVLAAALVLGFYQVRTLPYANAVAIPLLGAWLADLARRHGAPSLAARRGWPVVAGFLVAMPLVHLGIGWAAVEAVTLASGGRLAAEPRGDAPASIAAGLSNAEKDCIDPASAALLRSVPTGFVIAPVFYGSSVLALSDHSVLAAPYHRGGEAILASIRIMRGPADQNLAARGHRQHRNLATTSPVPLASSERYLAICATSQESALIAEEAPSGLLATLLSGRAVPGFEPVSAPHTTTLRLWRLQP